jgi:hypothetical protein
MPVASELSPIFKAGAPVPFSIVPSLASANLPTAALSMPMPNQGTAQGFLPKSLLNFFVAKSKN